MSSSPLDPTALKSALNSLLRGSSTDLDAYFADVQTHASLAGTKATVHCHALKLDAGGKPRIKDLARCIAGRVIEYAIPRGRIAEAERRDKATNSYRNVPELWRQAVSLFTNIAKTGEGGEMLLYALAQTFLGLPQLFCKMTLKTNAQMHVHGIDGIHAGLTPSGSLALYWGESKLYANVSKAVAECLKSIQPYLNSAGGSNAAPRRDIELIRAHVDLDDDTLNDAILRWLDKDDPAYNSVDFRGVCLIGFDDDCYAQVSDIDVANAVQAKIASWHKSLVTKTTKSNLAAVEMHVFLVPFPSVEDFRQAFLEELNV